MEKPLNIQVELRSLANKTIAAHSQRFFKTGKGQYGEGDIFLGIRVPVLRDFAKKHKNASMEEAACMLTSAFHEERLAALFIFIHLFNKGDEKTKDYIYNHYLDNTKHINNWDLVDCSAEHIVGAYLRKKSREPLYELAISDNLWDRRISIISTFHYIKLNEFTDTCKISELLLNDREDLIHKAAGWMLRETGKRNLEIEEQFLAKHYRNMPRTMLRYAIEKFPEGKRKKYLAGTI